MINAMQLAIIKKDLYGITANRRLFSIMIIVPLVMVIVMPTIFVLAVYFAPENAEDFQAMLGLLSIEESADIQHMVLSLILNSVLPIFFIIIPIMSASVMAASSFVGEKEKRTLETLLYCPLTLKQIFKSKIWASFIMSMMVSIISFIAMIIVVEIEILLTTGNILFPNVSWAVTMLLISPAISLIAITLIVRGSAKAQSMEESQQRSTFLVLPVVLLIVGQFTGIFLISGWMLLGIGVVLALIAAFYIKNAIGKLNYETILK